VGATLGPLLFGVAAGKVGLQVLPPVIVSFIYNHAGELVANSDM
jgi:hypothetical protein